ncbi:hydroxymethylbilane synthase [Natronospira proteinivora]|uniref:Porphobilinogen deaminase n=1 Tax=Natronospira proteinivora TaxID=1807133 RepID=A0ABT1G9X9_9GAMM|nr:hydroxymethylbilane synthase [Natronospira proteinivora]MCP1728129.1 hydroxymethylbilane synthase [Natronospira proteinivora]
MDRLRIATRQSKLALWQAQFAADELCKAHPGLSVELVPLSTRGDEFQSAPLSQIGGKGLFIKELERAMLAGEADIAVHSMKDLPAHLPEGFLLPSVLPRHDPRDAFISQRYASPAEMPAGAVLGTSSLRRQCLMKQQYPQLTVRFLRGNVQTRLSKLDAGEYDAIILAASGLDRMGLEGRIRRRLSPEESLPSVAQGTIGMECRADDHEIADLLRAVNDPDTWTRTLAERAMNARLNGSCSVPIAGFAQLADHSIHLRGMVGWPNGETVIRAEARGPADDPEAVGDQVGREIIERGGQEILDRLADEGHGA